MICRRMHAALPCPRSTIAWGNALPTHHVLIDGLGSLVLPQAVVWEPSWKLGSGADEQRGQAVA